MKGVQCSSVYCRGASWNNTVLCSLLLIKVHGKYTVSWASCEPGLCVAAAVWADEEAAGSLQCSAVQSSVQFSLSSAVFSAVHNAVQ